MNIRPLRLALTELYVKPTFSERGKHDNAATPSNLYNLIINELGLVDVCVDPQQLDFLNSELPDRAYCNPPFSQKAKFVEKACSEAKKGKLIVMLLPADTSTSWFVKAFYECKASVVFIAGKRLHGRYSKWPTMLLIFNNKQEVHIVKWNELHDFLKKYLAQ